MVSLGGSTIKLRRLSVFAALVLLNFSAVSADWPMYRANAQHTGETSEPLPEKLNLVWRASFPKLTAAWSDQPRLQFDSIYQPIVVGNRVIFGSPRNDSITALDFDTGKVAWRFFTGGPVRLPPAADAGKVFAGSDDGYLYALDAQSGNLIWKFKGAPKTRFVLGNERLIDTWPVRGAPVVADGKVYFSAGLWPFMGVFVYCVEAETGKVVWSNSGDGAAYMTQPHNAKAFAGIAPQGSFAVIGDKLMIPNGRAESACYNRLTGKMEYFAFANKFGGHEVVVTDKVFFNNGTVFSLTDGKHVGASPSDLVISGATGFGLIHDSIISFDMNSPAPDSTLFKYMKTLPQRYEQLTWIPFPGVESLIRAGSTLYAGGQNVIRAYELPLNDSKASRWEVAVEGEVVNLVAANRKLVAVTEDGNFFCFGDGPKAAESKIEVKKLPAEADAESPILKSLPSKQGYAIVVGSTGKKLVEQMIKQTELRVVVIEDDSEKAAGLRAELDESGNYGERVAVLQGNLATLPLPAYFASVLVATDADENEASLRNAYRLLHPYKGRAYFAPKQKEALLKLAQADWKGHASVSTTASGIQLLRTNGVPGGGNWTHENADAGNTRVSRDSVVKAPLGVLWFGGSSHDGILPRHGHGPQPQVIDGKLVIEGTDMLRGMDIYTGRVLWEAQLPGVGSFFNNVLHHPGANATGTNFISMPDGIYVTLRNSCFVIDPETGRQLREYKLPDDPAVKPDAIWSYLNVVGDYLIGGVAQPSLSHKISFDKKKTKEEEDDKIEDNTAPKGPVIPRTMSSKHLFAMNRHTGKLLWIVPAETEFRHNGTCAGGGRIYTIDRAYTPSVTWKAPKSVDALKGKLVALNLADGKKIWSRDDGIFGTWVSYSEEFDVIVEAGRFARDVLKDEPKGMRAYSGKDGSVLWADLKATGPAMIRNGTVLKESSACDLLTGAPLMVSDPLTGLDVEWKWTRMYGCNTPAASENLITFRSGAAGYYDLARNGGTGNFGGFRSSCTHNLLVAGGILTAPDYTRTCTCSYQLQTSLALVPDAEVEMWTFSGLADSKAPIKRLGVNFGAIGDRMDDNGTLWLEYPSSGGPQPKIEIKSDPSKPEVFTRHQSLIAGDHAWVTSSGVKNVRTISIGLNNSNSEFHKYTVRLFFAEPDAVKPGERVFDVVIQGNTVASALDVVKEAGAENKTLIKEFAHIYAEKRLEIDLRPAKKEMIPILCGVEIVAEANE